jgi:hypothetical protein
MNRRANCAWAWLLARAAGMKKEELIRLIKIEAAR